MFALFRLICTMLTMVLRILTKLRLSIPFIYILFMCSVFSEWATVNETFAFGILVALIGMVAVSWIVTFVKKIKKIA